MKLEELNQEGLDELVSSKETAETKVGELTSQLGERDAEIGEVKGELTKLTELGKTKDEALAVAEAATGEMTAKLEAATSGLTAAIQSYKEMALQANPNIPAELITGESIEELVASLEKANAVVAKVKETITAETKAGKVPAGAPQRTPPDLSALSPRDKIKHAINQQK